VASYRQALKTRSEYEMKQNKYGDDDNTSNNNNNNNNNINNNNSSVYSLKWLPAFEYQLQASTDGRERKLCEKT
jgi:hypothetical protein